MNDYEGKIEFYYGEKGEFAPIWNGINPVAASLVVLNFSPQRLTPLGDGSYFCGDYLLTPIFPIESPDADRILFNVSRREDKC